MSIVVQRMRRGTHLLFNALAYRGTAGFGLEDDVAGIFLQIESALALPPM
jgi:hypothetical protein